MVRLLKEPSGSGEEGTGEETGQEGLPLGGRKKREALTRMAFLRSNEHSKWLGQLQLLSSYMSARKLECLHFHDHIVPHFEYFDLDLLRVPGH